MWVKRTLAKNFPKEGNGRELNVTKGKGDRFFSLTDIAKLKKPSVMDTMIPNGFRKRNTTELPHFWKELYNPNIKPLKFNLFIFRVFQKYKEDENNSLKFKWGYLHHSAQVDFHILTDNPTRKRDYFFEKKQSNESIEAKVKQHLKQMGY